MYASSGQFLLGELQQGYPVQISGTFSILLDFYRPMLRIGILGNLSYTLTTITLAVKHISVYPARPAARLFFRG